MNPEGEVGDGGVCREIFAPRTSDQITLGGAGQPRAAVIFFFFLLIFAPNCFRSLLQLSVVCFFSLCSALFVMSLHARSARVLRAVNVCPLLYIISPLH